MTAPVAAQTPAELTYWIWEHRERLPMFVIYDKPERPGKFIALLWLSLPSPEYQQYALWSDDLDKLRDQLTGLGLTHLSPNENDDPTVLEIWL
jgi:hypothetical protein